MRLEFLHRELADVGSMQQGRWDDTRKLLAPTGWLVSGSADNGCHLLRRSRSHTGIRTPEIHPFHCDDEMTGAIKD
jgi:hypothetical protein